MVLDGDGRQRAFPFYVVCDVSQSMWHPEHNIGVRQVPLELLAEAVPQLIGKIQRKPAVADAAFMSVIGFHSSVEEVLPLTHLNDIVDLRPFKRGAQTNYAAAFQFLYERLREDCGRLSRSHRLKRPAIFFLTDGIPFYGSEAQPEHVWRVARDRLVALDVLPQIIAFGFGQARRNVLCKVATTQGSRPLAFIAKGGIDVAEVLGALMKTLFISINASVETGELSVRTPDSMSWACPAAAG
ncbi:vWA domain-containing protein [Nonomuraea fuscirosea]|uniref:vWA domain-containing protein n=1 Tax=Nonomuraea fuscirosea TaxID=1291556 RepID=UPI000D06CF04|nr:VWA domain-containing protein [Nonomuraea fuscirosea]